NKMLQQTQSNKKVTLNKLELLNQNIKTQRKLISNLNQEIMALDQQMNTLQANKKQLQGELTDLQDEYARLVRQAHYTQMHQSPLIFLFSSQNFQQLLRRLRYIREFSYYRTQQIEKITAKKQEIEDKNAQLNANRKNKQSSLKAQKREADQLSRNERKQQQMLTELKKQEKDLKAKLKKQQKQVAELNDKIDKQIRQQTKSAPTLTKEQQLVAGGFEANQGRLPWPVEKGHISGTFGKHSHPVYKEVIIDNKGIYLQTTKGADARAVYEGQVSSCFVMNNTYAVIIQHGNYRTVYSGLSKLSVKQGDKVTTKQAIGTIYTNPDEDNKTELYFQIYKDRNILNPSLWLSK
ncbi:MAG: peptidoglycan DD-metalloendopeptidase family protein, partial [Paludibacteraceae bacterium]|nr:peptidoglycan DD-metalloendopeptidase family protein [Paludibacteraceae bacterium]